MPLLTLCGCVKAKEEKEEENRVEQRSKKNNRNVSLAKVKRTKFNNKFKAKSTF